MDIAEQIHLEVRRLPKPLAQEVLDFIGYLAHRHGLDQDDTNLLKAAQKPSMRKVWDNADDAVWNDL